MIEAYTDILVLCSQGYMHSHSVYTMQPCTSLQCHFIRCYIRGVHVCLAVSCHLHFWQNDWGLLRATAVTRGWKGYRNKSQHRKLTLEKIILRQLMPGLEPATFRSRVRRSTYELSPLPAKYHRHHLHNNNNNNDHLKP